MSSLPLMLSEYGLDSNLSSWLASAFYAGLLAGTLLIERAIARVGHKDAFVSRIECLHCNDPCIAIDPTPSGMAISSLCGWCGCCRHIFVIVESWLMSGDESQRAKRLGIYMCSLYGGSAVGQLGIGYLGITGGVPFIAMFTLVVWCNHCVDVRTNDSTTNSRC